MSNYLEKLKNVFEKFTVTGSGGGKGVGNPLDLTNKKLRKELVEHFEVRLNQESVGKRMLYPMAFNILLHPDDYESRRESLAFVLPEVVSGFYEIIKKHKAEFPNFTPPANYWHFQLSPCRKKEIGLEKGSLMTTASLFALDFSASNIRTESNVRFSIKPQNSDVNSNKNINFDALMGIEQLSEGTFYIRFDNELRNETAVIMPQSEMASVGVLAELSYSHSGGTEHYPIKDNLIHISGNKDTRNARSIFKIKSDKIINSHVQICYFPTEDKFQIAAFGKTRLNSKLLELSEGGSIIWHDLANKSLIFMNDTIQVEFNINKMQQL